ESREPVHFVILTGAGCCTGVDESKIIKKRGPEHVGLVNQVILVGDLRTVRICQNIRGDKNRSFAEIVVVVPNREPVFLTKSMVHPAERSEEHTSELQSRVDLVCRLLLEKKK